MPQQSRPEDALEQALREAEARLAGAQSEQPSTAGFLRNLAASGIETAGGVVPGLARLLKAAVTDPQEAGRMMVEGIAEPLEALRSDPLGTMYHRPGAPLGVAANVIGGGLGVRGALRTPSAAVRGGMQLQRHAESLSPSSGMPAFSIPYTIARTLAKPALRGTGKAMERGGRMLGGNVPFHERPLYEQMASLPETHAPFTTRTSGPPHRPKTVLAGPAPRLVRGDPSLTTTQRLQDILNETRARAEQPATVSGPPSTLSMTPLGRPATGPATGPAAGRHSMGKAAQDVAERRVSKRPLPGGMTERRMDELVKKLGGTQPIAATPPAVPASWRPFISKSKASVAATLTENDVLELAKNFGTTPENIREIVTGGRAGRQGVYRADAEIRKILARKLEEP